LEEELRRRDAIISRLRETTEAEARVQDERIDSLERQIEQLVEISSRDVARRHPSKSSRGYEKSARVEMSALRELVARVIAEKDRLSAENRNLRDMIVKQQDYQESPRQVMATPSEAPVSRGPPTVDDNVTVHEDDSVSQQGCDESHQSQSHHASSENLEESFLSIVPISNEESLDESYKNICDREEEAEKVKRSQHSAALKMSCRACHKGHSHLKYAATYNVDANDRHAMVKLMKAHYAVIWRMVQEQRSQDCDGASICSAAHPDEFFGKENDFQSSSLARHLSKHCLNLETEGEVRRWCAENIKVEIPKDRTHKSSKSRKAANDAASKRDPPSRGSREDAKKKKSSFFDRKREERSRRERQGRI
jgi:hypothetical protein